MLTCDFNREIIQILYRVQYFVLEVLDTRQEKREVERKS